MAETTPKKTRKAPIRRAQTTSAEKPAAKPVAAEKVTVPKVAASRETAGKKVPAFKGTVVSEEQRYRMIAEAAYYRAESCQFKSDPLRDWVEAERDIDALLNEKHR